MQSVYGLLCNVKTQLLGYFSHELMSLFRCTRSSYFFGENFQGGIFPSIGSSGIDLPERRKDAFFSFLCHCLLERASRHRSMENFYECYLPPVQYGISSA